MPVHFARLRIAGFKSFAEPTSVEILPGLTGIVGPNGCGKSNVIEALRWAMGESSARSLRGGEMEDVIFAGTVGRAARNLAEVTISLDEAVGLAPPPYHELHELEISRRIERGAGSAYRINGKEARARDVQTLFADLASGARASAMVSQGKVGALVSARPEERRALLEEAAGITGLHARRHEAELKLRAAEQNLARAEDLRGQLEARLGDLKKQARQANRYRNLSGAIRDAELEWLAVQRAIAGAARLKARTAYDATHQDVARLTIETTATAAQAAATEADLPALRSIEADARTRLERARIEGEQLEQAESRARAALADAKRRLADLLRDHAHAEKQQADTEAALARLDDEQTRLTSEAEAAPAQLAALQQAADDALHHMQSAEQAANQATEAAARLDAETQATRKSLAEAEQRARRLAARLAEITAEHNRLRATQTPQATIDAAQAAQTEAEAAIQLAAADVIATEAARIEAEKTLAAARLAASTADAARARCKAESDALQAVIAGAQGKTQNRDFAPVLDQITVEPGFEAAFGAALRDEASASLDQAAPRHWRNLGDLAAPPAPSPGISLADKVSAPASLSRTLAHIFVLPDDTTDDAAAALQAGLAAGQCLVSKTGAIWRWDGYSARAGAPSAVAVTLTQRNRLAQLRGELEQAAAAADQAATARRDAEQAEKSARAAEEAARSARRQAETRIERARLAFASLQAEASRAAAKLAAIEPELGRVVAEHHEADTALHAASAAAAGLPDIAAARATLDLARRTLADARTSEQRARTAYEAARQRDEARQKRLGFLARERADWIERGADFASRTTDLAARRREAEADAARLAAAPDDAALSRRAALDVLQQAETSHRHHANALNNAVAQAEAAAKAARAAENALASARENLVRQEAAVTAADFAWGSVAERILERFGVDAALPTITDPAPDAEERAKKKWDRLTRERDEMGPVNLRAEMESEEAEKSIAAIEHERGEITSAIAKLRGSIGHLNREGRERLSAVFTEVDRHFQSLFARMFGGGKAHLALVGSDDPLEAGLEIYAQPPGKKLATLSLLSGGEQALTALSLIFAVFRCNPAPISVLDEVDAPLDDANVERFCTLLEEMVRETGTRFLVVTHHHLTMARMDRLYGVTMQERGISRILSVDFNTAADMIDPPRMAAE
jgi:chromosome segregation protein